MHHLILLIVSTSIGANILLKITTEMSGAVELIEYLQNSGYTENFILAKDKIMCLQNYQYYLPTEFLVDEIFRINEKTIGVEGYYIYALRQSSNQRRGIFIAQR